MQLLLPSAIFVLLNKNVQKWQNQLYAELLYLAM